MRMRIEAEGPEVGEVGVGEGIKFGGGHESAVAADGDALGGAALEFGGFRLAPVAGVLGENDGGKDECKAKRKDEEGSTSHQAAVSLFDECPRGEMDAWGCVGDGRERALGI